MGDHRLVNTLTHFLSLEYSIYNSLKCLLNSGHTGTYFTEGCSEGADNILPLHNIITTK